MPENADKPLLVPGLDLRALGLSAIAASVFFAWNIADSLSDPFRYGTTAISIAVDQAQLVAYLLAMSFGYVFVALGFAHFHQRKRQQLLPFSFMTTSLIVVMPFVAINAALQVARLIQIGRRPAEYSPMWWQEFTALVLSNLGTIMVVIFAARLYLHWRKVPPDPQDGARLAAISVTTALVAVMLILSWWVFRMWPQVASGSMPVTPLIIYVLSQSAYCIVWSAGVVFMYGFAAISVVRRLQMEHRLHVVTLASVV